MYTVHAICQTSDSLAFDIEGLDDNQDVFSINEGELSAIVSTGGETNFVNLSRELAIQLLLIHQRVVEAVMPCGPMMPVKFGTVLHEESEVRTLLQRAQELVSQTLEAYKGKVQMEVSVSWQTSEVFVALSQMISVVEMKEKAESGDAEARAMLGAHVKELMDQKRYAYVADILPRIKNITDHTIVQPVLADEVVLNAALLIDAVQEPLLDSVLAEIDKHYEGRFTIRCLGPMPLYSFTTLIVSKPSPEEIQSACALLGIPESTTISGIKRAYRKQAQQIHPDRSDDLIETEVNDKMAALASAYQLLTLYAKSQLNYTKNVEGERCYFDDQAIKNTVLFAVEKHLSQAPQPVAD